jgi:hypothetical protein
MAFPCCLHLIIFVHIATITVSNLADGNAGKAVGWSVKIN